MKLFLIILVLYLSSCSSVRKSAGVERKSIDELEVIENPPLVIPPDFNLLPPDQLKVKNIDNIENELAKEILFGSDNDDIKSEKKINTMNQILENTKGLDLSNSIREELDRDFAQEIKTDGIFQVDFENEVEILDAIKESERIRKKIFNGDSISEGKVPTKKEIIKKKKKKRFIFF